MITPRFRDGALWATLARLGGMAWCVGSLGCGSVPPPPPAVAAPAPLTRLLIANRTNYDWRITLTATTGKERLDLPVKPLASLNLGLVGGDYVIEQAVTSSGAAPELTRRISVHLDPGQTYHWRLDTLLSDSTGDPAHDRR